MSNNERVVIVCDELAGFTGVENYRYSEGVPVNTVYRDEVLAAVKETEGWRAEFFANKEDAIKRLEGSDQRKNVGGIVLSLSSQLRVGHAMPRDPLATVANQYQIPKALLVSAPSEGRRYLRERSPDIVVPKMPIESLGPRVGNWLMKLRLDMIS